MAIIAFYQLITSNGNEETAKKWKMTIFYAIIWFVLIKVAKLIVEWVYWTLNCNNKLWGILSSNTVNCVDKAEVTWFAKTILEIINWMNWFVWLVVVIMIIYAGVQVLTSAWDEEKMKKAKKSIIYIAIWLFILMANYLILTFFIKPETLT
jgi:Na+/proline symporter